MNKHLLLMMLLMPVVVFSMSNDELSKQYFSNEPIELTPQEKTAISIGHKWQTGSATSKPVAGRDGSIQFVYGSGQTQILCAVLQVCDVALQPGEQVNNLQVGDPRFQVDPAITGVGETERLHLLIKPQDAGLDTSLVVTTNRRTYHFRLRSSSKAFMPYISFTYPEEAQAKWDAIRIRDTQARIDNTLPQTGEYLGNLNFNYQLTGNARWKPCRVYNDGVKTIIEMPTAMQQSEAPTLLILRCGGLFKKDETVMVNYRVQNNRFIVDSVFDKAVLIAGVGRNQERVTITRSK